MIILHQRQLWEQVRSESASFYMHRNRRIWQKRRKMFLLNNFSLPLVIHGNTKCFEIQFDSIVFPSIAISLLHRCIQSQAVNCKKCFDCRRLIAIYVFIISSNWCVANSISNDRLDSLSLTQNYEDGERTARPTRASAPLFNLVLPATFYLDSVSHCDRIQSFKSSYAISVYDRYGDASVMSKTSFSRLFYVFIQRFIVSIIKVIQLSRLPLSRIGSRRERKSPKHVFFSPNFNCSSAMINGTQTCVVCVDYLLVFLSPARVRIRGAIFATTFCCVNWLWTKDVKNVFRLAFSVYMSSLTRNVSTDKIHFVFIWVYEKCFWDIRFT